MKYRVILTETAKSMLDRVRDQRIRRELLERMKGLEDAPGLQGKPLGKDLKGLRSVRAVGQRFRIIYSVIEEKVVVLVLTIGVRKAGDRADIYEETLRLLRKGRLDFDLEE